MRPALPAGSKTPLTDAVRTAERNSGAGQAGATALTERKTYTGYRLQVICNRNKPLLSRLCPQSALGGFAHPPREERRRVQEVAFA